MEDCRGVPLALPKVAGANVDFAQLYAVVAKMGGWLKVSQSFHQSSLLRSAAELPLAVSLWESRGKENPLRCSNLASPSAPFDTPPPPPPPALVSERRQTETLLRL